MPQEFAVHALTADRWPDFESVMGPQGACYGCWCTYFRMAPALRRDLPPAAKKDVMRERVEAGPPPGLIAYKDGRPVGWVQVTPRADVPNWNSSRTVSRPLEPQQANDPGIWAVSCFFVVSAFRGRGVSHLLLAAAVDYARQQGAKMLEACPIDRAKQSKSVGLYVGPTAIFRAAGFSRVALRKEGRPLMRLDLMDFVAAECQEAK